LFSMPALPDPRRRIMIHDRFTRLTRDWLSLLHPPVRERRRKRPFCDIKQVLVLYCLHAEMYGRKFTLKANLKSHSITFSSQALKPSAFNSGVNPFELALTHRDIERTRQLAPEWASWMTAPQRKDHHRRRRRRRQRRRWRQRWKDYSPSQLASAIAEIAATDQRYLRSSATPVRCRSLHHAPPDSPSLHRVRTRCVAAQAGIVTNV